MSSMRTSIAAFSMALLSAAAVSITTQDTAQAGWTTASSVVAADNDQGEADDKWVEKARSSDGDAALYATDKSNRVGDGAWLVLNFDKDGNGVESDCLRVNADFWAPIADKMRIDVRYDGEADFVPLLNGVVPNAEYQEFVLPKRGKVNAVRVRWHYIKSGYWFWLYELQLFEVEPPPIDPPEGETREPSSVNLASAVLRGSVSSDGGGACEVRFVYGTGAALPAGSSATAWTGSFGAGDEFTSFIEGLTSGVVYYYRAEVRNPEGVHCGEIKGFTACPEESDDGAVWVSPTGTTTEEHSYNATTYKWTDGGRAHDDWNASAARCYHEIHDPELWSPWLYLSAEAVMYNGLRFRAAKPDVFVERIEIEVFGSEWESVYAGGFAHDTFEVKEFTSRVVSRARVRFKMSKSGVGAYWNLYEFDFRKVGVNLIADGVPYYSEETPGVFIARGAPGVALRFEFCEGIEVWGAEQSVRVVATWGERVKLYSDAGCTQEFLPAGTVAGFHRRVYQLWNTEELAAFKSQMLDKTFYVKGVTASVAARDAVVICELFKHYAEAYCDELLASDRVNYTVVALDLKLDVDRSGGLVDGWDQLHEERPGGWVLVNDDNDNLNESVPGRPLLDIDEAVAGALEDDLVRLQLVGLSDLMDTGAEVVLRVSSSDGAVVRLWRSALKGVLQRLELTAGERRWDLGNAAARAELAGVCESGIWVEGESGGSLTVTLGVATSCGGGEGGGDPQIADTVKLLVLDDHNEGPASGGLGTFGSFAAMTSAWGAGAVNLSGGNLVFLKPLTRIGGNVGMPFNVVLSYNSRSKMPGGLGRKFRHNYQMRVLVAGRRLLLIDEFGRRTWYLRQDVGDAGRYLYKSESRRGRASFFEARLEAGKSFPDFAGYVLRRPSFVYWDFDARGMLVSIRDLQGGNPGAESLFDQAGSNSKIAVSYGSDAQGHVTDRVKEVSDSFSRKILFEGSASELKVTDPAGNVVTVRPAGVSGASVEACGFQGAGGTALTNFDSVVVGFVDALAGVTVLEVDAAGHGVVQSVRRPGTAQQPKVIQYLSATGEVAVTNWHDAGEAGVATWKYVVDVRRNVWTGFTNPLNHTAKRVYSLGPGSRLLVTEENFEQNTASWVYDAAENVKSHTKFDGKAHSYIWTGLNRLEKETSPQGRFTSRTYTVWGDLASFTNGRLQTTTYAEHDVHGRVGLVTLPKVKSDKAAATAEYGYSGHKLTGVTRRLPVEARVVSVEYVSDVLGRVTAVKDERGKWSQTAFDARGNATHVAGPLDVYLSDFPATLPGDALGGYVSSSYRADSSLREVRGRRGERTRLHVDELGRVAVTEEEYKAGEFNRYGTVYDGQDRAKRSGVYTGAVPGDGFVTVAAGDLDFTVSRTYYVDGALATRTPQGGGSEKYRYRPMGALEEHEDALGNKTVRKVDALNRLLELKAPGNASATVYELDADGLVFGVTDPTGRWVDYDLGPDGRVDAVLTAGGLTRFEYNGLGQRDYVKCPDGVEARTEFGSMGWALKHTSAANSLQRRVTTYSGHQPDGLVGTVQRPGRITETVQRNTRNLVYQTGFTPGYGITPVVEKTDHYVDGSSRVFTDGEGKRRESVLDLAGRQVAVKGQAPGGDAMVELLEREFSALGQVVLETVHTGEGYDAISATVYDKRGLWVKSTAGGVVHQCVRDANGDIGDEWRRGAGDLGADTLEEAQVRGLVVHYERDAQRRVKQRSRTIPDDTVQGWHYGESWAYGYDQAGRRELVVDSAGKVTRTEYDSEGRVWRVVDPRGAWLEYSYTAAGRVKARRDKNGRWTRFSYYDDGRLKTETNTAGDVTRYEYRDSENVVVIIDPDGGRTAVKRDGWGNVLAEKVWDGKDFQDVFNASYDQRGLLREAQRPGAGSVTHTYDNLGRLAARSYSASGVQLAYTYTLDGDVRTVTGGGTNLEYFYNEHRQLARKVDGSAGRELGWAYHANGNLKTRSVRLAGGGVDPDVPELEYHYDGADRLTRVRALQGGMAVAPDTEIGYTSTGLLSGVLRPNGVATGYGYDAADRLVSVEHVKDGSKLAATRYTLDNAGNRLRADYHDGSFNQWGYDAAYRVNFERWGSERLYYGYSSGGDRLWEAQAAAFTQQWSDDFERAEPGADYAIDGGEWQIAEIDGEKWLERAVTDPARATGPAKITNSAEIHSGYVQLSGEFAPLAGSAEAPLSCALVFGRTDDANYWLAGARSWTATLDGETEARLHLRYFIAEVDDGEFKLKEESVDPEVLPAGETSFQLFLEVQPTALELSRKYGSADREQKLSATNEWSFGSMPASRFGFYADRQPAIAAEAPAPPAPLEPAPCRFDDLQVRWATAAIEKATYAYHTHPETAFRTHKLKSVTGLGKDASYDYDARGNLAWKTTAGDVHGYKYTFENRLESVTKNGTTIRSYTFQGAGWQRRTATEDGVTSKLLYDGDNLISEINAAGITQSFYATRGLDSHLWTTRRDANGVMKLNTPLGDAQNVIAVANESGQVTARYRYRAFGKRFTLSGGNPARRDPSFQNRTYDAGLGIYDYRNRSFDPATGRFLQRDPVLDEQNLFNPYAGMGNNPVGNVDPMGDDFIETTGNNVYWVTEFKGTLWNSRGPKVLIGTSDAAGKVALGTWYGKPDTSVNLSRLKTRAKNYLVDNDSMASYSAPMMKQALRGAVGDLAERNRVGTSSAQAWDRFDRELTEPLEAPGLFLYDLYRSGGRVEWWEANRSSAADIMGQIHGEGAKRATQAALGIVLVAEVAIGAVVVAPVVVKAKVAAVAVGAKAKVVALAAKAAPLVPAAVQGARRYGRRAVDFVGTKGSQVWRAGGSAWQATGGRAANYVQSLRPGTAQHAVRQARRLAEGEGGRVFWSGGTPARQAAEAFARATGGRTLEMTRIGRVLDKISTAKTWPYLQPLWRVASKRFAAGAGSRIHVFQSMSRGVRLQSVWRMVEHPELTKRGTEIMYHVVK